MPAASPITVVVVAHDSADVLPGLCESLQAAAPRRGTILTVVDNASADRSTEVAARWTTPERLVVRPRNDGFAAGVNAGLALCDTPYVAVLNPDTRIPAGAIDALADVLDAAPRAALVAPRVRDARGRVERTIHQYPTLARETRHALGLGGRLARFPERTAPVASASACAWLLRRDAVRAIGPLDETFFMYFEDVDYCRRLTAAGWTILATPDVEILHEQGTGSRGTTAIPADGGLALLRYFARHHPEVPLARIQRVARAGWRVRFAWHTLRAWTGSARSAALRARYRAALDATAALTRRAHVH